MLLEYATSHANVLLCCDRYCVGYVADIAAIFLECDPLKWHLEINSIMISAPIVCLSYNFYAMKARARTRRVRPTRVHTCALPYTPT